MSRQRKWYEWISSMIVVSMLASPIAALAASMPGIISSEALAPIAHADVPDESGSVKQLATPAAPFEPNRPVRTVITPTLLTDTELIQLSPPGFSADAPGQTRLYLAAGDFDPLQTPILPNLAARLVQPKDVEATDGYWLVQFNGPIAEEDKVSLASSGYEIMNYVPDFAFVVRRSPTIIKEVQSLPRVRWAGAYLPAYRIAPSLLSDYVLPNRYESVELTVVTFRDVDLGMVTDRIKVLGGTVRDSSQTEWKGKLIVQVGALHIESIARIPGVQWIEPAPHWELFNNEAADIMGARPVWDTHGLYGAGQVVAIADSGLDQGSTAPGSLHDDFENGSGSSRVLQIFDRVGDGGEDRNSGHGTHVAGSVLGNGDLSGSTPSSHSYPNTAYVGMAPEASLVFQAIENDSGDITGLPVDLNTLFSEARGAGARIHTNSWGSSAAGIYTASSQDVDEYTWNNPDYTILFAASNYGVDANSDGVVDLYSLGSPATAKNCVTVGATENDRPSLTNTWGSAWPTDYPADPIASDYMADNTSGMAAFSSRGPTLDGRFKPDVVAPGTFIASTRSSLATGSGWGTIDANYMYMGGTSMATPLTAGAATLVREYYTNQGVTPSAALVKATLINGATDITPGQYGTGATQEIPDAPRPNNVEGWGRVNVENSLYPASRQLLYTDETTGLSTSQTHTYVYTVTNAAEPLQATLVWNDYPGTLAAAGGLVNDLDLTIAGPGGTYYPNRASQRGASQQLYYDDGVPYWNYNLSAGNRAAVRFTPGSYPVTLDRGVVFIYAPSYPSSFLLKVWDDDGTGGAPGTQLFSTSVTARTAGWMAIPVTGVTISSGSFYLGVELTTSGSPRPMTDYDSPGTQSWHYDGSTWYLWSTDPGYEEDLSIRAIVKSADYSTSNDRVNNVEGIDIDTPPVGQYVVTVNGYNVPQGPQPYALVLSGALYQAPTPPTAGFTANPTTPNVGETVVFNNTSTGSPPLSYVWDFDDGITSTLTNPTHAYVVTGTFTVTLLATNAYGSDSASLPINVSSATELTGSITTTFAGGYSLDGNMFDVYAVEDLTITSFDINCNAGAASVRVYYKAGAYAGFENNAGAWTLLGTQSVTCVGAGSPTPLAIGGLAIPAGQTYGLYITRDDGGNLNYTTGSNTYSNAQIQLTLGTGNAYPFGTFYSPRTWNGTIYYTYGPQAPPPCLSYTPPTLEATLLLSTSTTVPLTLTNCSDAGVATFELREQNDGFTPMLMVTGPFAAPKLMVPPQYQEAASTVGLNLPPTTVSTILAVGNVIQSWASGMTAAWGIAYEGNNNTVWVSDGWGDEDAIFEYSPNGTPTGRSHPYTWAPSYGPADNAFNWNTGMVWTLDAGGDNCLHEMNPASGYTGNTICGPWSISQRGVAYDPMSDTWYVGGWNDYTIYHINSSGTLLDSANVGLMISGLAYNPETQHLFVMVNGDPNPVYVLDAADSYTQTGQFNVSQGFGAYAGAGLEIDCHGNLWAVDQNTETVYQFESGETATLCTQDVPWLSESPITGTIPALSSQVIDVTFDASVVTQTGRYNATLHVISNDPLNPDIPVPVTMTVILEPVPPSNVIISGLATGFIDTTYAFTANVNPVSTTLPITYSWQATGQSPVLLVSNTLNDTVNWMWGTAGTKFITVTASNMTGTVTNYHTINVLLPPDITVSPASLSATVHLDGSDSRTLVIGNVGDVDLNWSMAENPSASWLDESPTGGVINPDGSTNVQVLFNALGLGAGTYTTILRITSNDPDENPVDVPVTMTVVPCSPLAGVNFSYTPVAPVADEVITFTASITAGTQPIYAWNFGDGGAGSGAEVMHAFTIAGAHVVTLTASNDCSAPQIVTKTVTVQPPPEINVHPLVLTATLIAGNSANRTLTISNTGQTNLNWSMVEVPAVSWLAESPTGGFILPNNRTDILVTFNSTGLEGSYDTSLRINSNDFNQTPLTVTVRLTVCVAVAGADFSYAPAFAVAGQPVTFTGSIGTGTPPITYNWDYGDTGTGSGQVATHAFTAAGTYTVTLTASNACPSQQVVQKTIIVHAPDITVSPSPITATLNTGVIFTRTLVIGNVGDADLVWSLVEDPSVSWLSESPSSGSIVPDGSAQLTVVFNATGLSVGVYATALRITSGDPDENPLLVPVTLTVTAESCLPVGGVNFTYTPASPVINQVVTFTASITGGTLPVEYAWNWRDGGTGIGQIAAHTFTTGGPYAVVVTATNACGQSANSRTVDVRSPDIGISPSAWGVQLQTNQTTTRTLTILNEGNANLHWSLAENPATAWLSESPTSGTISPGSNRKVTLTFNSTGLAVGTYNATLHITSDDPDELLVPVPVTLVVASTPCWPVGGLDFTNTPLTPLANQIAAFSATVTTGTTPINYAWTFGDGGAGSGQTANHAFGLAGSYTVILSATNYCQEQPATRSKTVTVIAPEIVVSPTSLAATLAPGVDTLNHTLTISNVGTADLHWTLAETPGVTWLRESPANGTVISKTGQSVVVTFEATGLTENVYTTTLRVTSDDPATPVYTVPVTLTVNVDFPLSPDEDAWTQVANDGINTPNNTTIIAMQAFGSYLYASTWNPTDGAAILRSTDGKTWSPVVTGGLGNPNNIGIYGLAEYNGYLYVGTRNDNVAQAPQIWRSQSGDPGSWEEVPNTGLGNEQLAYWSLLTYNNQLWAGCTTSNSKAELWKYNSATTNWSQEAILGFDAVNDGIYSLAEFQGDLYIGTSNAAGAEVWQRNGTTGVWTKVTQNGFGNAQNRIAYTMRVYNDVLYVGTLNWNTGAELYATRDGIAWERIFANGFDDASNIAIWNMLETGGYFYLATESASGGRIYRTSNGRTWEAVSLSGFGNPDGLNARGWGMAIFSSLDGLHLYVGTDNPTGAEIWRTVLPEPEEFWTQVERAGFDDDALNFSVLDYVEYNGVMYAVVANSKGVQVWRTTEGRTWTQVGTNGLGNPGNIGGYALTVHNGQLYVGTENINGAGVYRLQANGVDWEQTNLSGFGDVNNRAVYALASFGGYLYAGAWNFADRAEVWRYSGTSWENVSPPDATFEAGNKWIRSMVVYNNYLYIGTYNATGGELWRYNGTTWQLLNSDGQGDTNNDQILALYAFNGYLYAGYSNTVTGGQIWRSQDGLSGWAQVNRGGFGRVENDPTNNRILSMAEWDGYLYVGTENHQPILGYAQNFESGDGGFTISGSGVSWQWGTPTNGPGNAHSGTQVWATNLNGNYNLNEQSYLLSPEIDLHAYAGKTLTLSWWQWLQTESGYDIAAVAVSKDGGVAWDFVYVTSGNADLTWTQRYVTLDPTYAVNNFRVLFYLQSNVSNTYPGWYVDDIAIGISGTGGEIWRTAAGASQDDWEQVNTDGFSYQQNRGIWALEVFVDQLYAGTSNYDDGAEVWRAARPDIGPESPCCEVASVGIEVQGASWMQVQAGATALSPIHAPNAGIYDIPIKQAGDYAIAVEYVVGNQTWTQPIKVVAQTNGALQISHGEPTPRRGTQAPAEAWSRVANNGVNDADNTALTAMTAFKGYLYASTCNLVDGASIMRSPDGQTWGPVVSGGFGNPNNLCVYAMVEYNDYLYVGIRNDSGRARLYKSYTGDSGTWLEAPNTGLGDYQTAYWSLLNYNNLLWAGCSVANNVDTAELWTFNIADTPNQENIPGFDVDMNGDGYGDNAGIYVMSEFQGDLYIGTKNFATGAEVWRRDNSTGSWTRIVQNGFDDSCNVIIYAMEVYNDVLYVGTYNPCSGAELHATRDGNSWETIFTGGFDNPNNVAIWRLIESNGYLYLGTQNTAGGQVYRTVDGSFWTLVSLPGFGSANNTQVWGMGAFQKDGVTHLYAGTANSNTGAEIWRTIVPQPQESWMQVERAGIDDDVNNSAIWSTVEYNGFVYVGTYHDTGGAQVWRSNDGRSWLQVGPDGLDSTPDRAVNNRYVSALTVHNNQLYAGVGSGQGARVYRWNATNATWEQVNADGFGTVNNQSALELVSYNDSLYASTYNSTDSAKVFKYTGPGLNWTAVSPPLESSNWWIDAMTVYSSSGQSYLYIGTYNTTGGEIWRYNGSTWEAITTDGFGNSNNDEVQMLLGYQGHLYAGLWNNVNGAQVWRSVTGAAGTWTQVNRSGFGRQIPDPTNVGVPAMAEWNGILYVGTQNATTGSEVWRTTVGASQSDWEQVNTDGFGWKDNTAVMTLLGFGNYLYAGTRNTNTGAEIWRTGLPDLQPGRFAQVVNAGIHVSEPTTITVTGASNWNYYAPTRGTYAFSLPVAGVYHISASCGESFPIYLDTVPQVQFEQVSYIVGEAEGTAIITAVLDVTFMQTVTVNYSTEDGTATAGEDYTAISGTLTFAPGVTLQTFSVPITNDTLDEDNETVILTLSNASQAVIGSNNPATLTIRDDDVPVVQFDTTNYTVGEVEGSIIVTVALDIPAWQIVTVNYATEDGTATAGEDYTAISGTLTFTPGVTLQTFSVPITDDLQDEDNETVILTLSDASQAVIGSNNPATLTIRDDDVPVVQFDTTNYTVGEVEGSIIVTVALDIPAWQIVTVNYATEDGTATAGEDYTAISGILTFTPGVTLQTFSVPITDDTLDEDSETVILTLSDVSQAVIGSNNPVTLTILDDDVPVVQFSTPDYIVREVDGSALITVTLNATIWQTVTVNYTTADGTATAGEDYTAISGTLSFAPGIVVQNINVTIITDSLVEGDETVMLTLSNANGATIGDNDSAILTITEEMEKFKIYLPLVMRQLN